MHPDPLHSYFAHYFDRLNYATADAVQHEQRLMAYLAMLNTAPPTKGETVIEVGKVITREAFSGTYENTREENATVSMSENNISVAIHKDRPDGSRSSMYADGPLYLSSEQAIELAQILLKAAELQSEYSEASKKLREETEALNKRFKDLVSGDGTDVEVDVLDARGTFVTNKALG